ncbi:ErfK/YbiS/YcfS/YnhG family protein [hydrothermal vent metagenome]|uniref:ErfK/YbiS/YcfS/YnhG family protein n=1 Tax=hydrothermal vent metagenome TaxID=652676 RepID=A0A1W1EDT1_9ZZZZ
MLFFSGCNSANVKANQYSLKECKKEMLNADDYVASDSVDKIVVIKKKRRMYLYKGGKVVASYPVSLGKNPVGQKVQKGDNRTPEGQFWIHRKLCSPKYYRSLCISYPRPQDVARAEAKGLNPGGDITIHAQPKWNANGNGDKYTLGKNWTQGCVAITNSDMNKLWYAVREGVPVTIK